MRVMRTYVAIFSFVIALIAGGMCYQYSVKSDSARDNLDTERYQRISAEEKAFQAQERLKALESENERMARKVETLEKALEQKTGLMESLKARLDRSEGENTELAAEIHRLNALMADRMDSSLQGL